MAKTNLIFDENKTVVTSKIDEGLKYYDTVIGKYKSNVTGKTIEITFGEFVQKICDNYKDACKIFYRKNESVSNADQAKYLKKCLYFIWGYDHNNNYQTLVNDLKKVWNSSGWKQAGSMMFFKEGIKQDDRAVFAWAFANPVMFCGAMRDINGFSGGAAGSGSGSGSVTGTGSGSLLGDLDLSALAKYLFIGIAILVLIKKVK